MSVPYSSYSELSPSLYTDVSPLSEPDYVENALMLETCALGQPIRPPFPDQFAFPSQCPLPPQQCLAADIDNVGPFVWDNDAYPPAYHEHDHHPHPHHHHHPHVHVHEHDHEHDHDHDLDHDHQHPGVYLDGHGPLLQFPQDDPLSFSPEAYSPDYAHDLHLHHLHHLHHHADPYPGHTYTRMFRGRKSKAASEVLDELRPYACDICQAAFARSHDRDRHKRSHTGETPYQCHGCGAGFKRPDARKRHWERDPICAQEDWRRVQNTAEGAKRRARAKGRQLKPVKKSAVRHQ